MSDRTKKILFGIVFVVVSLGMGAAIYYFFFRPLTTLPSPTPETPPTGQLPGSGPAGQRPTVSSTTPGGLTPSTGAPNTGTPSAPSNTLLLRDGITQNVSSAPNGQGIRYYNPDDGKFYRMKDDGSTAALSDKQFFNVDTVSWGKASDKAVLEFPDGTNVFYDFATQRQVTLPKHWEGFDFSPDDERLAAKSIALDPNNRFLIVSKNDGNEAQAIEPLGDNANRVIVDWSPNNQMIAFSKTGRPQGEGGEEVYLVGEHHENFKSLVVPGRGFVPNWSPTGKQLLYSVYHERDDLKPSLWISDAAGDHVGENRRSLNLNTWADKCVWQDEFRIICGVPQSLDTGAGLERSQFATIPDNVYRVDLRTGVSVKINTPDQDHAIRQPTLSTDKKSLIFTDAATGRLYRYNLP